MFNMLIIFFSCWNRGQGGKYGFPLFPGGSQHRLLINKNNNISHTFVHIIDLYFIHSTKTDYLGCKTNSNRTAY